jgi:nitroreductase
MELADVIGKRRSVRKFLDKPVPDLSEILEMAKKGPSAGAIRGYKVFLTGFQIGPYEAPLYAAICADPEAYEKRYGSRGRDLYAVQDATIFGAYLQLLLVDAGLASCWIGAFREYKIQALMGTNLRPVAVIAIGYEA